MNKDTSKLLYYHVLGNIHIFGMGLVSVCCQHSDKDWKISDNDKLAECLFYLNYNVIEMKS